MNHNDSIREDLVQLFYNHAKTTRRRDVSLKFRELCQLAKDRHGYKQSDVTLNLHYLEEQGWVPKEEKMRQVPTRGGTLRSVTEVSFVITGPGMDHVEETESAFRAPSRYGININATGNNVITTGDGNVVRVKYENAYGALENLKQAVEADESLDEQQRLDIAIDIETLKVQLGRDDQDSNIVGTLWKRVTNALGVAAATVTLSPAVVSTLEAARTMLGPIVGA